jgi:UDP-glucose 4-epimerase
MGNGSMRIAVTGGSGLVGSAVVRELVNRGHSVINLDLRQARDPVARFVYLDLCNREILQQVLEDVEVVVHLGEIPHMGGRSHQQVYTTNTAIGATVLQTAADLRLRRAIYTSSCQVYGTWGGRRTPPVTLPLDETHPLRPQNGYALSKKANEEFSRLMTNHHGLNVSVFRLPWVVSDSVLRRLSRWMRNGSDEGSSLEMGTYVYTGDAARAYALAIEKDRPGWEVYHLSADDISLVEPLPVVQRKYLSDYPPLPADWPDYRSPMDTTRARQALDWSPQWSIREAYAQHTGRSLSDPARAAD